MAVSEHREDLLVRVAIMYYEQEYSQQEIADIVGGTRSNVSRLLKEARSKGIVEIRINKRVPTATALEAEFAEYFHLKRAIIVESTSKDISEVLPLAGILAAQHLEELFQLHIIRAGDVVAISWGTGVSSAVKALSPNPTLNIDVAQMIGSVGTVDSMIDGHELARQLATKLGGRYFYLHAPLIVDGEATRNRLLEQSTIMDSLARVRQAKIALLGIGTTEPAASSFLRAGHLTEAQLAELRVQGAVGECAGCYFDTHGNTEHFDINRRIVGLNFSELRNIPYVIAISCGLLKTRSILGALRSGYIHALATDEVTATAVLDQAHREDKHTRTSSL